MTRWQTSDVDIVEL